MSKKKIIKKKRLTLGIHLFRTNYYHQELKRKKEYHLVGYKRTKKRFYSMILHIYRYYLLFLLKKLKKKNKKKIK